jgi:hypothetical protein
MASSTVYLYLTSSQWSRKRQGGTRSEVTIRQKRFDYHTGWLTVHKRESKSIYNSIVGAFVKTSW